ncbi:hypothetical protein F4801DRAFT_526128 [Xylaria longipes]|nr:hypothetical protein F4801DRAFT_526128 [Xylaria longipes]RYC64584.1 hypothetical protein CHU98_g1649 [Xylaria longipes]
MAAETLSKDINDRTKPAYFETLHNVPKIMSELMESYAGIPKDQQIAHVTKLRNEAYAQFPYPCMGTFRFLDLDLSRHEAYKQHVLAPLCQPAIPGKPEPLFLDCGCCLGQDVRKLAADGAQPHRLWASDIEPRFIELGFELFRDGDKLPRDQFLCPGNMLIDADDASKDRLVTLNDKVTILNISAVFHLFDLDDHKRIANRCMKLLRKDTGAPALIIGAQVGGQEGKRLPRRVGGYRYQHSPESWEALWREVCGQSQWKDKVAALEVKAKNYGRVRNDDPDADEVITLGEPGDAASDARLWQMFEVWVTFKS